MAFVIPTLYIALLVGLWDGFPYTTEFGIAATAFSAFYFVKTKNPHCAEAAGLSAGALLLHIVLSSSLNEMSASSATAVKFLPAIVFLLCVVVTAFVAYFKRDV